MIALLFSLIFACSISATPMIYDGIQPRAQPLSVPNAGLAQGNLFAPPLPWGPPEFETNISPMPGRYEIPSLEVYMTALELVSELAVEDFSGRLSRPAQIVRLPQCPRTAISVAKHGNMPNLQRKYVLWGIARALNQFSVDDNFVATGFELVWRRQTVGSIFFLGGRSRLDSFPTIADLSGNNMTETTNATAPSLTEDNLSYDWDLHGDQLGLKNITMSAVGAMIQVANHRDHTFDFFVGSFFGYRCIWTILAHPRPSDLTKSIIVATIKAGVTYAVGPPADFRENKFVIKLNQVEIASGAYADFEIPMVSSAGSDFGLDDFVTMVV